MTLVVLGFIVSNEKRRELVRTKWLEMQISAASDSTADKQPFGAGDGNMAKLKYSKTDPQKQVSI